ncbi:hypothetical protein [Thiohalorhabdus methylotrophus]|uniref:Uncharacterized protein n=1 Tax=Thiohalorhabdus methylotrophus TaxID=3242694 RepID=A0ABV4TU12_9GAMM
MLDYSNLPALDWTDPESVNKARVQILRAEPVILNMPKGVDLAVDAASLGCRHDPDNGVLVSCRGPDCLRALSRLQGLDGLEELAPAAEQADATVDVDPGGRRIVIHH